MKIIVAGLWHTGTVISACLAEAGCSVIGFDDDKTVIHTLQQGEAPIYEPNLNELLQKNLATKQLHFTDDKNELKNTDLVWITYDTPLNSQSEPEPERVIEKICQLLPHLATHTLILISSQLPLGSTQSLQKIALSHHANKNFSFAYSPENLRLGCAIKVFHAQENYVVGIEKEKDKTRLEALFSLFVRHIVWTSITSAEMIKHALNSFLAMSIAFTNELASLCEKVGADPKELEAGLKSDPRVSPRAYVRAGSAFAGGTLGRDLNYLMKLSQQHQVNMPLITAISESNHYHESWIKRKLQDTLKHLPGKKIALLGLTYKPYTNTLRGSSALTTAQWLHEQGATVVAYDPAIKECPPSLQPSFQLHASATTACEGADAMVITTEWPEFSEIQSQDVMRWMKNPLVIDPNRFLEKTLKESANIRYFFVGKGITN